jgi:hypothetical protein
METIEEYVGQLQLGAEISDNSPEVQQAIYRHLQMEAKLTYEDDQHWADLRCILGEIRLPTDYNATHVFGMTKLTAGESCRENSGRGHELAAV